MEYISWSDVILNMGFLGFFMSAFTLKMWKEMMRNEHNTEYYDVYYDRGREIKREKNADAKLGGEDDDEQGRLGQCAAEDSGKTVVRGRSAKICKILKRKPLDRKKRQLL